MFTALFLFVSFRFLLQAWLDAAIAQTVKMIGSARIGIYTNANNWLEPQPRDRCRCALQWSLGSLWAHDSSSAVSFCRNVVMGGVKAYGSDPVWSVSAQSRASQWAVGRVAGLGPLPCFFGWLIMTCFFIFECCTMRDFIF